MLYCHLQHHNDTIIKTDAGRLLYKNMYLSLYCKGSKRLFGVCVWEGVGPNRNCNIFTPTLMAVSVVSFSFSRRSTGGPGAHSAGWWLSLLHLISNFSGPQLIRAPRPQGLMWLSLPQLVYNSVSICNCNSNSSGAPRPLQPDVALPTTSRLSPSDL